MIEGRKTEDKVVLWGGMVVTTFLMYLIYSYVRG